ncbi:MAG: metallophosphoesterase, partial [Clostridia bacterium]|nr:metallophosphoesterase [Clostridia bacterium]
MNEEEILSLDGNPSRVNIEIDGYWKEHIDEKIKNIPKGKSFIAFADWHFQMDGKRNSRKTTALIKYVREKTGIKKVLNLGDPIRSEDTFEKTRTMLRVSMEEYFYDVFGKDGLFAVGNHDSNVTRWLGASRREEDPEVEGVNGGGAFNHLVTQDDVYNVSVKHIEDIVKFDEKMIAKLDRLTYPEVGIPDGIYYSSEEIKRQAYVWAKMHYHYDDEENKIRYIVMDTGDCGLIGFYVLNMLWTAIFPVEYDWLVDTLKSTPEGYDIAVVGHLFASQKPGEGGRSHGIYKILSAFRGKRKVTFGIGNVNDNAKILIGDMEKNYDFTDSTFSGTVFTMGGHWHRERCFIWYTDEE